MEDLALVVGAMLIGSVVSIGLGTTMALLAVTKRRRTLAIRAHAVLVPGTFIGVMLATTTPGVVFLVLAGAAHLIAAWGWSRHGDDGQPASPAEPDQLGAGGQ